MNRPAAASQVAARELKTAPAVTATDVLGSDELLEYDPPSLGARGRQSGRAGQPRARPVVRGRDHHQPADHGCGRPPPVQLDATYLEAAGLGAALGTGRARV